MFAAIILTRTVQVCVTSTCLTSSPVCVCVCVFRQLLGEAETLRLVSQLLRSIDKVSTVHADS